MLIVFDVGNSEITLAVFRGDAMIARGRIPTWATAAVAHTPEQLEQAVRACLDAATAAGQAVSVADISAAAIGSVVPVVTSALEAMCGRAFGVTPVLVDARSPLPIRVAVDAPLFVGADRLINTFAAYRLHARDTICVDLGTATTLDCITADGRFLGGIIMPGVGTAAASLIRGTSQLPSIALVAPDRAIGRNTDECLRAGVMFGAADAIDGAVRRIRAEWPEGGEPWVVATGGLARTVAPLCREVDAVDPDLTLHGLRMAHEFLQSNAR